MPSKKLYRSQLLNWSAGLDGETYLAIDRSISFLSDYLYHDYEPAYELREDFYSRLTKWIFNAEDDDKQKLLLKLVPEIFYIGQDEFNSLYKTAYHSNIHDWLMEQSSVNFETEDYENNLHIALSNTWFCPVTDSFRINQFYHLNSIKCKTTFRPDWRSLKQFGDESKIIDYILQQGIKYIVLLEDFVGSGKQSRPTLEFALNLVRNPRLDDSVSILFVPLLICPAGLKKVASIFQDRARATISPVICVKPSDLINEKEANRDLQVLAWIELVKSTFSQVKGSLVNKEIAKLKEFGFDNTGSLIVMYTNTPNNSLPLIFVESDSWSPLFKRHTRD
jgi:hypothetical protein